jgi:hypothetical protein
MARSLVPLLLLLVAVFVFHLRHRTHRTFVLFMLGALLVGVVATGEVYALAGDPDYDAGESWEHHHQRREEFFGRLGVVFIARDVALLVFTGAMIFVLSRPGTDSHAVPAPRLNFVVQHLLGLKEALIGCFVAMSFSRSVVEVFGD